MRLVSHETCLRFDPVASRGSCGHDKLSAVQTSNRKGAKFVLRFLCD